MPSITLDEIKADIAKKYEPLVVPFDGETVTLTQALRLPREKRQAIAKVQAEVNKLDNTADDAEDKLIEALGQMVRLAATDSAAADRLLALIGDDLPVLLGVIEQYGKATQLGEA